MTQQQIDQSLLIALTPDTLEMLAAIVEVPVTELTQDATNPSNWIWDQEPGVGWMGCLLPEKYEGIIMAEIDDNGNVIVSDM